MRTPIDDDDLDIPEIDLSTVEWRPNPFAKRPGEKTEIFIDGAVAYQLRLIPSNKVLGRFRSTLEAWPAIIAVTDGGRSPRTLSLDWVGADGAFETISAGPRLEGWARRNNGERAESTRPRIRTPVTPGPRRRSPARGRQPAEPTRTC
ncbi:MAG: hypothetical protein ACXWXR_09190 [Candidatus Limnocylindrales bacterium]